MRTSWDDSAQASRGPAIYYGYCGRTKRYRMMDLTDYMANMQEGVTRMMDDAQATYREMARNYTRAPGMGADAGDWMRGLSTHGCRHCGKQQCDCHCECCVCDADVLIYGRCGEIRRIPISFDNDSRREREVKLELGEFLTSGGRNLGWKAQLSETSFTLRGCDSHTVILTVGIVCAKPQNQPAPATPAGTTDTGRLATNVTRDTGSVDSCEVGYAPLRAEGCFVRPMNIAIAVLPDDCDSYHRSCGGCCN